MRMEKEFSDYLKEEFVRRCRDNSSYSLRAFASQLEVNHSTLSRILNGKRKATPTLIRKLSEKVGLGPLDAENFISSTTRQSELTEQLKNVRQLEQDTFEVISEWYHFALLEIIRIPDEPHSIKNFSHRLNLRPIEVELAMDRMQRLDLICWNPTTEKWEDLTGGSTETTVHFFTSEAKKKYQRQLFEKALKAIDQFDIEHRSHSGTTMAISSSKLHIAKKKIQKFRLEMASLLQGEDSDEVFHLGIALFPLTQKKRQEI